MIYTFYYFIFLINDFLNGRIRSSKSEGEYVYAVFFQWQDARPGGKHAKNSTTSLIARGSTRTECRSSNGPYTPKRIEDNTQMLRTYQRFSLFLYLFWQEFETSQNSTFVSIYSRRIATRAYYSQFLFRVAQYRHNRATLALSTESRIEYEFDVKFLSSLFLIVRCRC